jgi:hypothetical protein
MGEEHAPRPSMLSLSAAAGVAERQTVARIATTIRFKSGARDETLGARSTLNIRRLCRSGMKQTHARAISPLSIL